MPPAQREVFLTNITRETERMQEVVDRILELAVLEARRAPERTAPLRLAALLDELLPSLRASAALREVSIELTADGDPVVFGDAFLLRRAVTNLVDNAVAFSPAGGVVRVALRTTAAEASITVRDDGPGVPEFARDRVFDKFYSLPRPATGRKSTGLGLSFVRQIATLHQGGVRLESEPGAGTVATLVLPRQASG